MTSLHRGGREIEKMEIRGDFQSLTGVTGGGKGSVQKLEI